MASKMPQVLRNLNLYVDGRDYAGRVDEITLPKLTLKTEEYRAGGMDAPIEVDMGLEKLEASFTVSDYDPNLFTKLGLAPGEMVNITMRGALDQDGAITPIRVTLNGSWTEIDMGSWSAGDKSELKVSIAARHYSLSIDNQDVILIDVPNMTRVINGVDALADIRAAIGA